MNRKTFSSRFLINDIFSGMIVALVSIPISMGYAQIAGLPPVYGLYGSLLPILIFSLITTSPQFVVGVDAMPVAMLGSAMTEFGIAAFSPQALKVVPAVTLLISIWLLVFKFLKAGRIVKYISNPVMGGFISGIGCTIILMQIPKLFGGSAGTGEIISLIPHIIHELSFFNLPSFIFGITTIALILGAKKIFPKFPMAVLLLLAGILIVKFFNVNEAGVKLLPAVEKGLPHLSFPDLSTLKNNFPDYLFLSFTIALVIMVQTLLATNSYANKYDYFVNNDRELLAYAAMNFAGSISGACPINGSVSRSSLADQFGTKSQFMSITSFVTMLLIILFCTQYFVFLPVPLLTGIVVTALIGIVDVKQAKELWKISKSDFWIFIAAFVSVLIFGTIYGVITGVVLSFIMVVKKAVIPPRSFIGKIPNQHGYYNLIRNKNSVSIKNTVIYKFGGNLFFANTEIFQKDIESSIKEDTKFVIVDASGIGDIDIAAAKKLLYIANKLEKQNIKFYITEHQGYINDQLRLYGAGKLIENGNVRRTVSLALRTCGFKKPYPLEENAEGKISDPTQADERFAEFEWAFGKAAESKLKEIADEVVTSIKTISFRENIENLNIEDLERKSKWGKISYFDEGELLEDIEIELEELVEKGSLDQDKLNQLEKIISMRKSVIEEKLNRINPNGTKILHEKLKAVEEHLKKTNPVALEKILKLREKIQNEG